MRLCYLVIAAALLGSCGILGPKTDPPPTLNVPTGTTGCLNNGGIKIQAFFDGTVDPVDWKATFDCVLQSLALLQKYTVTPAFTPGDIQVLAKTFLFSSRPVPIELVQAAFQVKASILGGSDQLLTMDELSQFAAALTLIRDESGALIPVMKTRKTSPTAAHMLELMQELSGATSRVGAFFTGKGALPLPRSAMETIALESGPVLGLNLPSGIVDQLLAGKELLFSGAEDAVEQEIWPDAIQTAGLVAGIFIAYSSAAEWSGAPNDQGEFNYRLAVGVHDVLVAAAGRHAGGIPLSEVNQLIDTLPATLSFGTLPAISHSSIEAELPVVFSRLFPSGVANAIDSGALDAMIGLLGEWTRGNTHLEAIFSQLDPQSVATDQFAATAGAYEAGLVDPADHEAVERLIAIAGNYVPQFPGDDNEILFAPGVRHSRAGLERLNWMDLLADLILSSYGSGGSLGFDDFSAIIDDIHPIAVELGVIDPNVELFAERRFRELNLFTLASDANDTLEKDEIMSYLMIIRSLSATTSRMRADVEPACGGPEIDGVGWHYMNPTCFRRVYFANADRYWDHAPELLRQYHALSGPARNEFQVAIEKAARYQGYGNQALGGYDAEGFILFMILQETMFLRFDTDWDGYLNTDEALAAAVPMREFIAKQANLDPNQEKILGILNEDEALDAIFTYILAKGKVPKMDISGYFELALWILKKDSWHLHAGRADAYRNAYTFADFSRFPP